MDEITDLLDAEAAKLALPVLADGMPGTGPQPGKDIFGAGGGSSRAGMLARGKVAAVAVKLEPAAAEAAATSKSTC